MLIAKHKLNTVSTFFYSVGLSLALIMFVGFLLKSVFTFGWYFKSNLNFASVYYLKFYFLGIMGFESKERATAVVYI